LLASALGKTSLSNHLFIYGTLKTGVVPPEVAHAVQKLKPVANATVHGFLYDLGAYPGAILNSGSAQTISGLVVQFPNDPTVLAQLDQYEEFDQDSPETSQFLRVRGIAVLESGRKIGCWIYVYNHDPGSAPLLKDGKFPKQPC
jgi:gamma-glutamylcyclotransferase (GGCT)/AIG2-like uncharacterized protein YtfP